MERLQVGRTPLREALKRLAAEQLVVALPHRTPVVRPFSLTDLEPLFETRMLIEVPVCGLAAQRITPAELRTLYETLDILAQHVAARDVYQMVETDYVFHSQIAHATGNRFLADAINQFNLASLRLWYLAHSRVGVERVVDTHRQLIETLETRDPQVAEAVMREHVEMSRRRVVHAFMSGQDLAPSFQRVP